MLERINKTTLGKAVLDCIQLKENQSRKSSLFILITTLFILRLGRDKLPPLENRDHFVLKIPFFTVKGIKSPF